MAPQQIPPRKSGFAHFLAAASYSVAGLKRLSRESAFRQEAGLGLLAVLVLAISGAPLLALCGMVALVLLLIATEALNTALEVLVDHLSPQWSQFAKDAKDLGSLAVACVAVVAIGYFVLALCWA
ncbi:diacylglycerol kinase [Xinfangfangia sp. CPCC 101601]|uniref:Diacylglycerol kinase n=1 Tax=Pseudogemmobacter lacusdianii TaxID=3069608 RepID=A0ABU0VWC4_9RHOB|nr:diacylglycerol kinase [Xinfangfangia sp. CPCC 101601]MDQ2065933.1 diacylglycerol kinase [Xinfangfangia sp. CPCC 101601]